MPGARTSSASAPSAPSPQGAPTPPPQTPQPPRGQPQADEASTRAQQAQAKAQEAYGKEQEAQAHAVEATPAAPPPVVSAVSEAELRALRSALPELVSKGVLSKADATALEQYIRSGKAPDGETGRALLQKALDTMETLKESGHEIVRPSKHAGEGRDSASARPAGEVAGGRTIDDVVLKASSTSLQLTDFELLSSATRAEQGAQNLADALEWMISQPNGSQRMHDLLGQAALPGNTTYMSQALARMGQATPEQTLGLLLLTTDRQEGASQLVRFFGAMADKPAAAGQFATLFEGLTRSTQAAGCMAELLDVLSGTWSDDRSGSRTLARLFRESSRQSQGASSINKGFGRTLEVEGGARAFARILNRLSTGADDTRAFLHNLGNQDSGSEAVGRLLSRATASRDGARQVLDSFTRLAAADEGQRKTGDILSRVIESHSGARFVANMTSDAQAARGFEALLDQLDRASGDVSARLSHAFEKLSTHPDAALLRQRASEAPDLSGILERYTPTRAETASASVRADAASTAPAPSDARTDTPSNVVPSSSPSSQQQQQHHQGQNGGGGFLLSAGTSRTTRKARTTEAVGEVEESREGEPENGASKTSSRFRPGDVYSKSTLLAARICGECGFRLSPGGRCVRCEEYAMREHAAVKQTQAVRPL